MRAAVFVNVTVFYFYFAKAWLNYALTFPNIGCIMYIIGHSNQIGLVSEQEKKLAYGTGV